MQFLFSSSRVSYTPVLIMGHSFVHCFHSFLAQGSDRRVRLDLNLSRLAHVNYHGVGGRTVDKLSRFVLSVVGRLKPEIVILELGVNDLSPNGASPECVGSEMESLVQLLHAQYRMKFIVVCQTINRVLCSRGNPYHNDRVALLNWYLSIVLETLPLLFLGATKGFVSLMFPYFVGMESTLIIRVNMLSIGVTGVPFYAL